MLAEDLDGRAYGGAGVLLVPGAEILLEGVG